MKKFVGMLVALVSVLVFIPSVNAEKVKLYMFSKVGCPNCETAENYFNNLLKNNNDEFEYIIIEAYDEYGDVVSEDAKNLMTATLEEFEEDTTPYFPTIVIGDTLHIGAGNLPDVYEKIKEAKESKTYEDKVAGIAKKLDIDINKIKKKVKLYMFSKVGCPNCETAENYFNNLLKNNNDEFEYIIIEAYDEYGDVVSEDAKNLMTATLEEFEEDTTPYFPTIVVGDTLHIGAGNLPDVYEKIKEAKEGDNYEDKVAQVAKKLDVNIDKIKRISAEEKEEKEKNSDAIILVVIFVVVIGGFAGLIFLGKK